MIELTTTVQCDCGKKLKVQISKRENLPQEHEDNDGDIACFLSVSDGEFLPYESGPVTVTYKFVCKECLGEKV